jgi:hypothetical protein
MRKVVLAATAIPMFAAAAALAQNAPSSDTGPANTPPASMSNPPTGAHTTTAADTPSKRSELHLGAGERNA